MGRYKADIGGGSLKLPEARIIAGLLLKGINENDWKHAIEKENVLEKRSIGTAKRQSSLIKARLEMMDEDLMEIVRDEPSNIALQALFAAAIKHSYLLGDFIDQPLREQFRLFKTHINKGLWRQYLEVCREQDPKMPIWQESTEEKLGDSVFQILAEVGYINNTRDMKLQNVRIAPKILDYLKKRDEDYVLKCIQIP